jgi:hypothetical protein
LAAQVVANFATLRVSGLHLRSVGRGCGPHADGLARCRPALGGLLSLRIRRNRSRKEMFMTPFPALMMAALVACLAAPAQAQPVAAPEGARAPGELRQARQQQRIASGVAHGRLTPRETAQLEREQAQVDRAQARAGADGKVTRGERQRIDEMQDRASRKIHHKKHNERTAG